MDDFCPICKCLCDTTKTPPDSAKLREDGARGTIINLSLSLFVCACVYAHVCAYVCVCDYNHKHALPNKFVIVIHLMVMAL